MSLEILNSAVAGDMQVADRVSTAGSRAALLYFRVFFCISVFFLRNLVQGWQRHAWYTKHFGHEKVGLIIGQKTMETHIPGGNKARNHLSASNLVLLAKPPSQSHDGTEVRNPPMLDAVITYPPSPGPDTLSSWVPLRSSTSLAQLSAADTLYGLAG